MGYKKATVSLVKKYINAVVQSNSLVLSTYTKYEKLFHSIGDCIKVQLLAFWLKKRSGINNNTDVVNVRVSQQSEKMANRKAWIKSAISMYTEVFETLGEDPRTMHLGLEERKLVAGQLASACMISNEIAKLRTEIGQAADDIGR